jgi:preprotein translocase subunit YajC
MIFAHASGWYPNDRRIGMLHGVLLFAQEKGAGGEGNALITFAPLILLVILFYFLIIAPARRKERQQREMLDKNLKKNDRVLTNAGIIGTVSNITGEQVTLKLDEGKMRILKSTIARILGDEEPGKDAKEPGK